VNDVLISTFIGVRKAEEIISDVEVPIGSWLAFHLTTDASTSPDSRRGSTMDNSTARRCLAGRSTYFVTHRTLSNIQPKVEKSPGPR